MSNAEMNRRLANISPAAIGFAEWLIKEGYGAQSIKIETGLKLSVVNAIFKKVEG